MAKKEISSIDVKVKRGRPATQTQAVVAILKEIEDNTGFIKPKRLVDAARDPKSPIHSMFEWDNSAAAEKYRLWQARTIINHVQVELMERKTDAFHSVEVEIDDVPQRAYFSTEKVLSDEEIFLSLMQDALREIRYWQKKYKELKELSGLINSDQLAALESAVRTKKKE